MASVHRNRSKTGFVVRWRSADGKPHWKTVPGKKVNALKVARDIEQRAALGPLYEAPAETLGAFLSAWLERYSQRVRPSTHARRVEALRALGVLEERDLSAKRAPGVAATRGESLSSSYLQNLSAAELEDALAALAERAPRQAQLALESLKLALRSAKQRGQRFDKAILALAKNRYTEREPRFLGWEQVQELASFMPEPVKRIVPIAALTGLRQGELFDLKEEDLDLDAATLRVRSGKTKAARRVVALPARAVALLREQLVARRHTADCLVFPAPQGGRLRRHNFLNRWFRPAVEQSGLGDVHFHDLRHTACSLMLAAGWNFKEIAEQIGHNDGGVLVMRRYGHLQKGARRRAAVALEAFLAREQEERSEETGA